MTAPELDPLEMDERCVECGGDDAEFHETYRQHLHPACVGPWLGGVADYAGRLPEGV